MVGLSQYKPKSGSIKLLQDTYGSKLTIVKAKFDDKKSNELKMQFYTDKFTKNDGTLYDYTLKLERWEGYKNKTLRKLVLSVVTVPFKVRPGVDGVPSTMEAGLSNAGVVLGRQWVRELFTYDGKITVKSHNLGILVAPGSVELNDLNTNGAQEDSIDQFALSLGLSYTFTYNGISVSLVPLGFDFGFSEEIQEDWVYNGQPWFGFGIGVDPKVLLGKKLGK